MNAIDKACQAFREVAIREGLARIEVEIRADGRVYIRKLSGKGHTVGQVAHADLLEGSALPLPSVAIVAPREVSCGMCGTPGTYIAEDGLERCNGCGCH